VLDHREREPWQVGRGSWFVVRGSWAGTDPGPSRMKRLPGVSPPKGLREYGVEVVDELLQPCSQISDRLERRSFQRPSDQNAEPNLHLIHPRCVTRGVHETNPVSRVFEELPSSRHRLENAGAPFDAQISVDAAPLSNEPDKRLRLVRIELIEHDDPARVGVRVDGMPDVFGKVRLSPSRADGRGDGLAGRHKEARDQAQRAVAYILEFTAFDQPRPGRFRRMEPFARLDPGLLVHTHDVCTGFVQGRGVRVRLANRPDVVLELLRILELVPGRQPVLALVRSDRVFFRKRAMCRGEMVSTIPRFVTS